MITQTELATRDERTGPQTQQAIHASAVISNDGALPKVLPITYQEIRDLRKDPTIALTRELMPGPILAANWSVEAAGTLHINEEDVPRERVQFIKDNLMPVRDTLLTVTIRGLLDFGWQPFEKVFYVDDNGFTRLLRLKALLQDYTEVLVDQHGAYMGLLQRHLSPEFTHVYLSKAKSLCFTTDMEGTNWYGTSRFEYAKASIQDWRDSNKGANQYDKKVAGSHWVVYYPVGNTDYNGVTDMDNFLIAKDILSKLEASGGIVVPNAINKFVSDMSEAEAGWKIDTISDITARQYSFVARLAYIDKCKVRAMGYPERAILEGNFGTKAESGTHANIAATAQDVRHRYITAEINEQVVDLLLLLNWGPEAIGSVRVRPAPITDANLSFLQDAYKVMCNNPEVVIAEHQSVDMREFRDKVAVPNREDVDPDSITYQRGVGIGTNNNQE